MFKIHEIREMIKLVDEFSIQHLEIEEGDSKVSIQRKVTTDRAITQKSNAIKTLATRPVSEPSAVLATPTIKESSQTHVQAAAKKESIEKVQSAPQNESNENLSEIVSPMVGTFYRAPGEGEAPFVKVGEKVEKSTVVCILEAMKLFNEVEADIDGEIVEVLVENGQLVEYGQPLFLVKQTS